MSDVIRYGSEREMVAAIRGGGARFDLEKAKKNSKGVKIKLIDAITDAQTFNLPVKSEKGNTVYRSVTFEPGVLYKAPKDDATFLNALLTRGETRKKYSVELEEKLKASDTPYTVKQCKSCGGGLRKIELQIFEVTGNE